MGEISDALERAKTEQERATTEKAHKSASSNSRPTARKPDRDYFPLSLEEVSADVASPEQAEDGPPESARERGSARRALDAASESATRAETTAPVKSAASTTSADERRVTLSRDRDDNWRARTVLIEEGNAAEQYRHFAIRLGREIASRHLKSIAIVSGLRQEGKTTTACNLSLAMSSIGGGRRIALVDLDLRRPSVARYMGLKPKVGIDSVLAGHAYLRDARIITDVPGFDVYPVAHAMNDAHERIAHQRMGEILAELESLHDLVILDSAPVLMVSDTGMLAPLVGGCIAVLRSRQTHRQAFLRMLEILPREKLLGIFLNEVRRPTFSRYTAGYYESDGYMTGDGETES